MKRMGRQTYEKAEKTKLLILKTAIKVFSKNGFYDANLREIAQKAGVSHSLIRHHFGSKQDLWKAVIDYGYDLRYDTVYKIIDKQNEMDAIDFLKKFLKSHIQFCAENSDIAKILLHWYNAEGAQLDYILEKQSPINEAAKKSFKKAQKEGYFKGFTYETITVYMRALVETPISNWQLSNKLLQHDIRSEEGIALHSERVIHFLFRK